MSSVTAYAESVASCHAPTPIRSPSPAAVAAAALPDAPPHPVRRQLDFPDGGGDCNLDDDDDDDFFFRAAEEMERSLHESRASQGLTLPPVALAPPTFPEKQCICRRGPCDVEWREPGGWAYVCSAPPKCNHFSCCEKSHVNPDSRPTFGSHPEPNHPHVLNTRHNHMANATTQVNVSPQGAGAITPVNVSPQGAGTTTPVNFSPHGAKSSGLPICKCTAGECRTVKEKGVSYYVCHIQKGYGACSHREPVNATAEKLPVTGYNNSRETGHLLYNPVMKEADGPNVVMMGGHNETTPFNPDGACSHREPVNTTAEELPVTGYNNPRETGHLLYNPVTKEANGHNVMMGGHNETRPFNPDEPPKYDDGDWPFDIVEGDVVPADCLSPAHPSSVVALPRGSPTVLQQPVGMVELETPMKSPPPKYTFSPTTPRSKDCYRCGVEGHLAVNCPKNTTCYRCNLVGHWVKDCPEVLSKRS